VSGASDPRAWIEKAHQDARAARRLLTDPVELEPAAYHVQQAAEKAIKAVLAAACIKIPRDRGTGHNLAILAKLISADDGCRPQAQALADLTPWATAYRYPADDPFTAQPPPTRSEVETRLIEVEAFVAAVAAHVILPS
jgi:HEPN domain-containing protein